MCSTHTHTHNNSYSGPIIVGEILFLHLGKNPESQIENPHHRGDLGENSELKRERKKSIRNSTTFSVVNGWILSNSSDNETEKALDILTMNFRSRIQRGGLLL